MSNCDIDDIEKMLELKTEFHASSQLEERILSVIPDVTEDEEVCNREERIKEMPSHIDLKPKIGYRWALTGVAAAIIALVVITQIPMSDNDDSICYMVKDGKRITDEKAVIADVKQSLTDVLSSQNVPDVESELQEVFNN